MPISTNVKFQNRPTLVDKDLSIQPLVFSNIKEPRWLKGSNPRHIIDATNIKGYFYLSFSRRINDFLSTVVSTYGTAESVMCDVIKIHQKRKDERIRRKENPRLRDG